MLSKSTGAVALGIGLLVGQPAAAQTPPPSPAETRAIAKEAYIYAFAMTEGYNTMYKQLSDPAGREYVGGFGRFRHYSEAFTPENRDIVTPNNDTPYSWAWLDLRAEPWVVSVPAVPGKRYYVQQWIDLFTHNFAYIGSRATGNQAGNYLFAGPRWKGETPPGIEQVFHAETDIVLSLTRTALNGPDDVEAVKAVQAGMKLQPLSSFRKTAAPPAAPAITLPPYDVAKARSHDFIGYLNFLLQFTQPPHPSEVELMKRFATIGIGRGLPFDATKLPPATLAAIDDGVSDAKEALAAKSKVTLSSNGIFGSRAELKNDYLIRASPRKRACTAIRSPRPGTAAISAMAASCRRFISLRAGTTPARQVLLVDDPLHAARPLSLCQSAQALFDRLPHAGADNEARCRRRRHVVPRPCIARRREGVQLAADAGGQVQRRRAHLWPQRSGDERDVEAAAADACCRAVAAEGANPSTAATELGPALPAVPTYS